MHDTPPGSKDLRHIRDRRRNCRYTDKTEAISRLPLTRPHPFDILLVCLFLSVLYTHVNQPTNMSDPTVVVDENNEAENSGISPSKADTGSTSGYTLQSKPASVTLGRKESLTKKTTAPDALEETKDFVSLSYYYESQQPYADASLVRGHVGSDYHANQQWAAQPKRVARSYSLQLSRFTNQILCPITTHVPIIPDIELYEPGSTWWRADTYSERVLQSQETCCCDEAGTDGKERGIPKSSAATETTRD